MSNPATRVLGAIFSAAVAQALAFAAASLLSALFIPLWCALRFIRRIFVAVAFPSTAALSADHVVVVIGASSRQGTAAVRSLASLKCSVIACDPQAVRLHSLFGRVSNVRCHSFRWEGGSVETSSLRDAVRNSGKVLYAVLVFQPNPCEMYSDLAAARLDITEADRIPVPSRLALAAPPLCGKHAFASVNYHCGDAAKDFTTILSMQQRLCKEMLPALGDAATTLRSTSGSWRTLGAPRFVWIVPDVETPDRQAAFDTSSSDRGGSEQPGVGGSEVSNRLLGAIMLRDAASSVLSALRRHVIAEGVRVLELRLVSTDHEMRKIAKLSNVGQHSMSPARDRESSAEEDEAAARDEGEHPAPSSSSSASSESAPTSNAVDPVTAAAVALLPENLQYVHGPSGGVLRAWWLDAARRVGDVNRSTTPSAFGLQGALDAVIGTP